MAAIPSIEEILDAREGRGDWRAARDELLGLAASGRLGEAHGRLAMTGGTPDADIASLAFDLEEAAGRRGARRILRRARQRAASDGLGLDEAAWAPLEAWAHFRLWRHGRALASAEEALGRKDAGASAPEIRGGMEPLVDRLWVESLGAIMGLALRQGYLRHAQRAGLLVERFAALSAPAPMDDGARVARTLAALAELLDGHRAHGVPASLLRYLGRSLGHVEGDSEAAAREVARDLSVTPANLVLARFLASRLGLPPAVSERLRAIEEHGFRGHWRARRLGLRVAVMIFVGLLAGLLVLGLTLLQHRFL